MALQQLDYSVEEIAELLDKTQLADEFSWDQIVKISGFLSAYYADNGDVIYKEGDHDESMAIIAKGSIKITKTDTNNNTSTLAQLHASQSLGEMALIDGEPRSADVIASTNVILLILSKKNLNQLAKKIPALGMKLLWKIARTISQRLRKTSSNLVENLHK